MVVHIGRDRARLVLWGATLLVLAGSLTLMDLSSGGGLFTLFLDAFIFPVIVVALLRLGKKQERTLVRANNRLLLDGEPLEMARVELRVLKLPITRVPTGYALSLWVMTASGPEDVPIGRFATLLEASALSGQLEDFVQRANVKQHRHA
ncbi:MAG: hypothetical protein Q8L48_18090 [Archangium sp.]|nr:hypothetical protein [Archangium sp.]